MNNKVVSGRGAYDVGGVYGLDLQCLLLQPRICASRPHQLTQQYLVLYQSVQVQIQVPYSEIITASAEVNVV